jgi:hypothetical protein
MRFLDTFLRAIAMISPASTKVSILQALNLMNNNALVEQRPGPDRRQCESNCWWARAPRSGTEIVNLLYLNILSRYPSTEEMTKATAAIPFGHGHRERPSDSGSGVVAVQQGRFHFQLLAKENVDDA